ncbi:pre-peptidase C-terminal domain-containing protein, partial [Dolichospermum circinale CS-545/17]|nr:pre-peptidase C-terminal domain-containing protein [Dolichospermum circinale CS-545/17]
WQNQDFSVIPNIQILSGAELCGAIGAYAQATNTIYLSQDYLNQNSNNIASITSLLLEEIGHAVDAKINILDASGDEGAIFSGVVQSKIFEPEQLQQLKDKDDHTTITLDGQVIHIEKASVSDSGGQRSTPSIYPLSLQSDLNLVTFSWENYGIPDEFQILYEGNRIVGDVGLQPGGKSGKTIIGKNSSNELEIKVTSPNAGTAWNFSVATSPLEITVNGLLGDVIKVDIGEELKKLGVLLSDLDLDPNSFGLKNTTSTDDRGSVATNIDDYASNLQKGIFYFVPKVTGTPLQFGQARNDVGIGQSTLTLTNGKIEIPVKFNITDGFSTTGDNKVETGTKKLAIYRQEQRLAYLGFPPQSGNNLVVDGNDNDLSWAIQLFNIATSQRPLGSYASGGRGRVTNHPSTLKESEINSSNVPKWTNLNGIQNFTFVDTQRRFGINSSASAIQGATNALGININSTGVTGSNGSGDPSTSHDGGRGVDIDTRPQEGYHPGANFFRETRINNVWYVAASNNQIIIRNPNGTYQAAASTPQNLVNAVRGSQAFNNQQILNGISGFLQDNTNIGYNLNDIQTLIQSFQNTGLVGRVLYNDPRTWGGVVGFYSGHNGHIHFEITTPALGANATGFNLQSSNIETFSPKLDLANNTTTAISPLTNVLISSVNNNFSNAIELGQLEGNVDLTGAISSANPEIYYRFTLGNPIEEDEVYFFTYRDFSLLLNGLSADVDVELIQDFNGDNIRQDYEVVASSEESGNSDETINITDLSPNIYYVRVIQKSGDTNYNLNLSVPPLPVPTDNAGNTVNTAKDLGVIGNNVQLSDFIGQVDSNDYYRFTLSSTSDLSIEVTGLSNGDLFAELGQDKNNDGILDFDETIASSDEKGDTSEGISRTGLAAGEYILHLGVNSGNTNYDLKLSAPPANIPPDKAGNTPSTAFDIGSLNAVASFSDFVGNVDPEDFYQFTLGDVKGLKIELNGLSGDADVELAQDTNNNGVIDSNEIISMSELQGSDAEFIHVSALAAGNYLVRVYQYDGDTNYNLSITLTTPVGSDLSVTRTDISGAVDLGQQYIYSLTVTNNGPDTANNVILTENLPSGVSFLSATTTNFQPVTQNNGVVTANLGNLDSGKSVTVNLTGKTFIAGNLLGKTSITSDALDYNSANNSLESINKVNSIVSPNADLELTQTIDNPNPNVGDKITLTLQLTDKGPGTATAIKVQNILPTTLDFVSATPTVGSYDPNTGIWNVGNIAPNSTVQLSMVATVNSVQPITITAEVIAVDETDPDSTPNNNNPNEDDQVSITLNAALATPTLAKTADDIFTIFSGSGNPKLQVTLAGRNSNLVNELAVFTVDDAQGKINGIAPGETGYTQAALNKSKVIFSTIANVPNGFDINNLTSLLEFESGNNLRFLLVKNGTIDSVQNGNTPTSDILFSDLSRQKITDLGTDGFSLAWKDGSNNDTDFKDLVVNIKSTNDPLPLGTNLQGKQQGEVLDLRGIAQDVKADFTVNREAAFNNFVGFYKVADENGGIDVDADGTVDFRPGDSGYAQAAIKNRVAGIDLRVDNQGTASFTDKTLTGGSIFAPFILTNGRTVDQVLNGQVDQAY